MSLLSRLMRTAPDDRAPLRPLWSRIVAIARDPQWYLRGGIADTQEGRFDALTMVLALVLIRMEGTPALAGPTARLTELFVEDMDGQMRQGGVGDLVVGKHIGKLMSTLGGRIGAYREALAGSDDAALVEAVQRNIGLTANGNAAAIAAEMRVLAGALAGTSDTALLAGEIVR